MEQAQTQEAPAPMGRWRRTLGLVAVVGGVFIAVLDIQARAQSSFEIPVLVFAIDIQFKSQGSFPIPTLILERWADWLPAGLWVPQVVYASLLLVSLPVWGKLSDVYGRRGLWLAGVLLFMAGSAGSGIAEELFPAQFPLAGLAHALGAGAIGVLGAAFIGDLYQPSERAKWHGVLAAAVGLGLFGEPTVRHMLWQLAPATETIFGIELRDLSFVRPWPLYVNLPIGGLVVLASWFGLPAVRPGARSPIDVRGALALAGTVILLLMPLQVASSGGIGVFPWLSVPTVALLAGAAIMLWVLLVMLRRAPDPLINLRLLTNRTYLIAILLGTLAGVALAVAQRYSGFFFHEGIGNTYNDSNPFRYPEQVAAALAFAASALVAGQLMWRTGRSKRPILALLLIAMVGAVLLSRLNSQTTVAELAIGMAVTGLGVGGLSALLIAVVQNACPYRNLGEVTAGLSFFGALGVALVDPLIAWLARASYLDSRQRPPADLGAPVDAYAAQQDALGIVFVATGVLLAIGFVLALWLPETLGTRKTASIAPTKPNSPTIPHVPTIAQRRRIRAAQQPTTDPVVDDASGAAPPSGVP